MSKVAVTKDKLDYLANAISAKSGESLTLTLDEMIEAVDGIETGGGTPTLETITKTYTPSTTAVTDTITASSGYDGIEEVDVTVSAVPVASPEILKDYGFYTNNGIRKWRVRGEVFVDSSEGFDEGYISEGTYYGSYSNFSAIATGTSITPTESTQTIGGAATMLEGAVTVNAIPSNYVGSGITQRSSSDLTASGATVTVPSGYYSAQASKAVASGSVTSLTATKGNLSHGEILVYPHLSVSGGYIDTITDQAGTPVITDVYDFVSGNTDTITTNGTHSVAMLESVDVTVQPTLQAKTNISPTTSSQNIQADNGYDGLSSVQINAMPSGTAGTPTATKGTVSNHSVSVTPSVTNTTGYITGGTKTGTAVSVSASELVSGTYTVDSSGTKDVTNYASASVPSGTAGTPSASKGTVSNHSITVTPSVTNQTGWITGSTKTGTAVTVSASELVSGSETKTANGTYDVTNLAELIVNVSGGGGVGLSVDAVLFGGITPTTSYSIAPLLGEPTSFVILAQSDTITPTSNYKYVASLVYDGSSSGHAFGSVITTTNNAQVTYESSAATFSYNSGSLMVTLDDAYFGAFDNGYVIIYTYGGGSIDTKDVQVGSGATSITFTGLEDEPEYWSCAFKSNFGTSSGYQRVIAVANALSNIAGLEMDSGAHTAQHWTSSYSNGSLTITSQGTNAGGYFHQPGYYQLTYAYDDGSSGNYQSKTVTPTTSQQVITADSGYDALKQVTVNAMPSGSATAPASISGTAASVSTGTNTLTLTKTVSITPTVTAGYISSGTAGNSSVSLTASVTTKAAATITPTTTNQTIAAGTYLTGIQTIAGDADLVGGNILSTANIFGVQGTVVVQNYYTGSSAPSSSTGSNGDLYLQS